MKKLIMLAPIAILAACSEKAAVENAVRGFLIDPDSAKFGEITIVETSDGRKACVTTNAKNRMGGYTGDKQISLFYDEEAGVWKAVTSWDWSHEMCLQAISGEAEEADEEPSLLRH
ncbi:hypothetical protein GRI43_08500 [Altererythrobacter luteolus]|uniref:Lipoprotein n=1 Tax=Pontixanthobacter luteolus TaxID=295089 RepID=A0A6I4UZJ7_9SPHN|nr:hypothetical protein [Pontixanthobacter luteolus]MXP47419.1 hypothetical protein [Pontixanthobacter luteolus]